MSSNLDKYRDDLKKLISLSEQMSLDLTIRSLELEGKLDKKSIKAKEKIHGCFERDYQKWYTESYIVLKQLIPERLAEFEAIYKGGIEKRKKIDLTSYTIQDWLTGIRSASKEFGGKYFEDSNIVSMRFNAQLEILKSVENRFESSLFDIKQLIQADLFDSELDAARELLKNGFIRPAGVIAGVVLEGHLSQVSKNHSITIRKKNKTISDYNDALKNNKIIDIPYWRFIQRLGDLRNLCGHKKEREPNKEEIIELIDGVDKITKTLF